MSSSGLIYAAIVGAWAAYLVPMWLRREDELNEARPTERFGTAIRLLSGRAGMERRYAKELREAAEREEGDQVDLAVPDEGSTGLPAGGVDVRALANPVTERHEVPGPATMARSEAPTEVRRPTHAHRPDATGRTRRAKLLARRRRTTMVLFLAFTLGAIVAAVGGIAFLWAPAIPAGLLSAYIAHMRAQERRRFAYVMDQRRAEAAARRLRERRSAPADSEPEPVAEPAVPDPEVAAERRVLVEQTDHAEWVDSQRRERAPRPADGSWEPTPVPLPTYVNAPVAPRTARGVDLGAPDTWSSARSTTASAPAQPSADRPPVSAPRRQTPLFDQYADEDRPRAANE